MNKQTATERLRALLDERGEHYETSGNKTWWGRPVDSRTGEPINVYHNQAQPMGDDRLFVEMQMATPERAVEATIGMGTCKMDTFADIKFQDMDEDEEGCYEIGALAECGECGAIVLMPPEYAHFDRESLFAATNFCPNCGRKVANEQ